MIEAHQQPLGQLGAALHHRLILNLARRPSRSSPCSVYASWDTWASTQADGSHATARAISALSLATAGCSVDQGGPSAAYTQVVSFLHVETMSSPKNRLEGLPSSPGNNVSGRVAGRYPYPSYTRSRVSLPSPPSRNRPSAQQQYQNRQHSRR